MILCAPVIDPLGRYHYAKKLKAAGPPYPTLVDEVLPGHDAYGQTGPRPWAIRTWSWSR